MAAAQFAEPVLFGRIIDKLAEGLETQLGPAWPGGVEESFGQWQKLALARGFMREGQLLLVLDEPTAALDAQSGQRIMELLRAEKAEDIVVIAGGFLPDPEEVEAIRKVGVKAVFDTDTRIAVALAESLVEKYDDTFVYTIEGNTNAKGAREGNCVAAHVRKVADCTLGFLDPGKLFA